MDKYLGKFIEVGKKIIEENVRCKDASSIFVGYYKSNYRLQYICVQKYGAIGTVHDLSGSGIPLVDGNIVLVETMMDQAASTAENRIMLKWTELRKKISRASNRKKSAPVLIVLPDCVVNARLLLKIMEACSTDEVFIAKAPIGDSVRELPYVCSPDYNQEGFLFPVLGQNISGKSVFDCYVPSTWDGK